MKCPICDKEVGSGIEVFERTSQAGEEWCCCVGCCNKCAPQGEFWSTWKPAVCVEEVVSLNGAVVTKAGVVGGKGPNKKGMSVLLPGDTSLDEIDHLLMDEVTLIISKRRIQSLPDSPPDEGAVDNAGMFVSEIPIDDLGLELLEEAELKQAGLLTVQHVVDQRTIAALQRKAGFNYQRASRVMSACKAALTK